MLFPFFHGKGLLSSCFQAARLGKARILKLSLGRGRVCWDRQERAAEGRQGCVLRRGNALLWQALVHTATQNSKGLTLPCTDCLHLLGLCPSSSRSWMSSSAQPSPFPQPALGPYSKSVGQGSMLSKWRQYRCLMNVCVCVYSAVTHSNNKCITPKIETRK